MRRFVIATNQLDARYKICIRDELRIWREATTILMGSGMADVGRTALRLPPYGEGFPVEIYRSTEGTFLRSTVRSPEKLKVMKIVQGNYTDQLREYGVEERILRYSDWPSEQKHLGNARAIILVSNYIVAPVKEPHGVLLQRISKDKSNT